MKHFNIRSHPLFSLQSSHSNQHFNRGVLQFKYFTYRCSFSAVTLNKGSMKLFFFLHTTWGFCGVSLQKMGKNNFTKTTQQNKQKYRKSKTFISSKIGVLLHLSNCLCPAMATSLLVSALYGQTQFGFGCQLDNSGGTAAFICSNPFW